MIRSLSRTAAWSESKNAHGVCRCWGRRAPAPAPPGTLRIPGEPVNVPYRILNPGACMMCIGGIAASETSDACTACLEPRCTRWKEGAQKRYATEGGRVPKTEGDASPRGEKTVYNAGRKGRGRRPATTPEHRRGGCIRGRGAVAAEMESRRLATCPCGWHQEHPGCTRGHGARQGAESTYNAPRGGGPGTLGHSPSAVGQGPWNTRNTRWAPEATIPAREQNRLTMLREGEVRVP